MSWSLQGKPRVTVSGIRRRWAIAMLKVKLKRKGKPEPMELAFGQLIKRAQEILEKQMKGERK